ncbi:MAG: hypothetical protein ACLTHQ_08930 [Odoribacter splanchnicus]
MKNLFCLCILLLIGSMQMSRASDKIEKQPLKVLYVGGSADIQVLNETISDSTALRKSIADRTAAWGDAPTVFPDCESRCGGGLDAGHVPGIRCDRDGWPAKSHQTRLAGKGRFR